MPAHKVIRVVLLGWWLINKLLYFFRIISQTGSIGPAKKDKVSTFIKIWKLSFHIPFQNNVNPELKINLGLLRNVITGQENFSSVTTSLTSKQKHEVKKRYLFSRNVIVVWFFFFLVGYLRIRSKWRANRYLVRTNGNLDRTLSFDRLLFWALKPTRRLMNLSPFTETDPHVSNTVDTLLTDTSVKRTPRVGPCLSLVPLFDSL